MTETNRFPLKFDEIGKLFMSPQIIGFVWLTLLTGCGDKVGAPVNMNVAQQTLATAMEAWKEGKSSKDLLDHKPPIIVQEMEWNNETTLLDYDIVSDDKPAGPNLIATVKLKLSKSGGKVTQKMATYVVGTSPKLTVYRNMMK